MPEWGRGWGEGAGGGGGEGEGARWVRVCLRVMSQAVKAPKAAG